MTGRFALVGMGKMGKGIFQYAQYRKNTVVTTITSSTVNKKEALQNDDIDVIIDFSTPSAVDQNINLYCELGIPVVLGTTGLEEHILQNLEIAGVPCVYDSNFSVGAYLFSEIVRYTSKKLKTYPQYQPSLFEHHHVDKKDAPSGTALALAQEISTNSFRAIPPSIVSIRKGSICGTHQVSFDSSIDSIDLTHRAHSRDGFIQGAVLSAEWLVNKRNKGIYTASDVFKAGL